MNPENKRIRWLVIFVIMSVTGFLIWFLRKPKKK
jgi:hypothetical protein